MAPTIDSFFARLPVSSPASSTTLTSRKRSREPSAAADKISKTKKAKTEPKSKLKKSTTPTWTRPAYSLEEPTGENAQKCIQKWGLIAPFDSGITETQWEQYFEERSAVEKTNTKGTADFKKISSEELMQNTDRLLADAREKLVKVIMGSCLDDAEKIKIADAFKESLYYLSLWGNEEDGYGFPITPKTCHT